MHMAPGRACRAPDTTAMSIDAAAIDAGDGDRANVATLADVGELKISARASSMGFACYSEGATATTSRKTLPHQAFGELSWYRCRHRRSSAWPSTARQGYADHNRPRHRHGSGHHQP
jgi:hypothetical protein